LDISIPVEPTVILHPETVEVLSSKAVDQEGVVVNSSIAIANDDSGGSLQQEQFNSSPGRSPHAAKASWTVSGFSFVLLCTNRRQRLTVLNSV